MEIYDEELQKALAESAAAEQERAEKARKEQERLSGWDINDVSGDGNCFFRAVVDQFQKFDEQLVSRRESPSYITGIKVKLDKLLVSSEVRNKIYSQLSLIVKEKVRVLGNHDYLRLLVGLSMWRRGNPDVEAFPILAKIYEDSEYVGEDDLPELEVAQEIASIFDVVVMTANPQCDPVNWTCVGPDGPIEIGNLPQDKPRVRLVLTGGNHYQSVIATAEEKALRDLGSKVITITILVSFVECGFVNALCAKITPFISSCVAPFKDNEAGQFALIGKDFIRQLFRNSSIDARTIGTLLVGITATSNSFSPSDVYAFIGAVIDATPEEIRKDLSLIIDEAFKMMAVLEDGIAARRAASNLLIWAATNNQEGVMKHIFDNYRLQIDIPTTFDIVLQLPEDRRNMVLVKLFQEGSLQLDSKYRGIEPHATLREFITNNSEQYPEINQYVQKITKADSGMHSSVN
jgi:hypothetical protein